MKRAPWAVAGVALVLLGGYLAWEWYLSPVARVRRTLHDAAEAAERVDVDAFLSLLSPRYSDFLHPDRDSLEARLRESFSRLDRLNVTLRSVDVTVQGGEAVARFDVVVVAVRGEERFVVMGTPFEPEKLEGHLERDAGAWKIRSVAPRPGDR